MLTVDRETFERLCYLLLNVGGVDAKGHVHDILSLLGLQAPEQASQGARIAELERALETEAASSKEYQQRAADLEHDRDQWSEECARLRSELKTEMQLRVRKSSSGQPPFQNRRPGRPPYETAPRLTKGVRYRVVVSRGPYWAVGEEFVLAHELSGADGWFTIPFIDGSHRVVRVEPEKCARCQGHGTLVYGEGCPDCKGTGENPDH